MDGEARQAFLTTLRSRWSALLAFAFALVPLVALFAHVVDPRVSGAPDTAFVVTGFGRFPSLAFALVLVGMLATGELAPRARALPLYAARLGAFLLVLVLAWMLPGAALSLWGGTTPAPVVLATAAAALEMAATLAVLSLLAEFGRSRPAFVAVAYLIVVTQLLPVATYATFGLFARGVDTSVAQWLAIHVVSPTTAGDGLLAALFPETVFLVPEDERLDHPVAFSPWTWAGVLLAWTLVPLAILAAADARKPPEGGEDEPLAAF